MNTDEKFEQIYSKILEENSQILEELRHETKDELTTFWIFSSIIVVIILILLLVHSIVSIIILFLLLFFVIPKIVPNYEKSKTYKYENYFKTKIIRTLLNSLNKTIEYFPTDGINSSIYNEAEFEAYSKYTSDDLIHGSLNNNCNFEMSEVLTEIYTGVKYNPYSIAFSGLFAKIETPKTFNTRLYLRKAQKPIDVVIKFLDKISTDISIAFSKNTIKNLKIDLDSPEFERYFDVYCTDKIAAMKLLSSDVMQLLIDFQKEMNIDCELTIKSNFIYIRFMSGELFEPAVSQCALDKDTFYKYYRILDFLFRLSNKLI